jgi:hypothetical protein
MTTPIPPFWFKQRQCKAAPVEGQPMLKLSGPNLGEAFIHVRQQGERWVAGFRRSADGADEATAESPRPGENAAWEAAFELYRTHVIV